MASKKLAVTELKQINFYLNEKGGGLSSSMKTHVAMQNDDIEIIWIKFKNSLKPNPDACIRIDMKSKTLSLIKKYYDSIAKNKNLMELIKYYSDAGFKINSDILEKKTK